MDGSSEGITYVGTYEVRSAPGPEGWLDGAPKSARDQSCVFCGRDAAWAHPLAPDFVTYSSYGKQHTLPTFWTLRDRCEALHASGDVDAAVEVMLASDWISDAEDVTESLLKPLAAFRRADLGARRLEP